MASKLDQILVIDLECTCWEKDPPEGQQAEIIEIGICTLDMESLDRLDRHCIMVRPEVSKISPFCSKLTSIKPKDVVDGTSFSDACKFLTKQLHSKDRLWASWGDFDRRHFEMQCHRTGVDYPFGPTHLNIKNLFALMHGLPRELSLKEALDYLDLEQEGTPHRGVDDAWNIAALLAIVMSVKRAEEQS